MFQLIAALLQLKDQLIEALVDITSLLLIQPLNFRLNVVDEAPVVVVDALCVDHKLVQVVYVLFDDVRDVL